MFSCKTAGLWNLLTMCPDRGTSPRPEKGVCRVVGPGSTLPGWQVQFLSDISERRTNDPGCKKLKLRSNHYAIAPDFQ